MNSRERTLMFVLVGILVVGGAAVGLYNWFLKPLADYNTKLAELDEEVALKEDQLKQLRQERKRLEEARKLSLPGHPDKALTEYAKYLRPVLKDSGLTDIEITAPQLPAETKVNPAAPKKAGHIYLAYQVRAKGGLKELVTALEKIQRTPVMHRVKSFALDRSDTSGKDTTGKLNIQMTVECMIVHQASPQNQPALKPDYAKRLPHDSKPRYYADIAKNNVFVGPVPAPPPVTTKNVEPVDEGPDMREFIRLVSTNPTLQEAHLRNLLVKTREMRLKSVPMSGYDFFSVNSEDGNRTLFKAKVLRIEQRDVYFQVKNDVYGIHIGQSLADAMKRPLSTQELKTLDLFGASGQEEKKAVASPAKEKSKGESQKSQEEEKGSR